MNTVTAKVLLDECASPKTRVYRGIYLNISVIAGKWELVGTQLLSDLLVPKVSHLSYSIWLKPCCRKSLVKVVANAFLFIRRDVVTFCKLRHLCLSSMVTLESRCAGRPAITDLNEVNEMTLFTVALTVTCVRSIAKDVFTPVTIECCQC